jgi:hypothetical protein
MDKRERFMEAVAAKVGKRKPMMKRKPGMAVMIAIGAPKKPPMGDEMEDTMDEKPEGKMGKAEKIAMLQEKIASLKAELALLEDEDEMGDENQMEKDESEYEDEDED